MQEIEKYAQENVNRLLVANKCDAADKRKVTYEEGFELAKSYNIPFIEASAKTALNIE
jgi:GTPase SAR1 family protein